ncbi:zinc-binding dehydrogenase [Streptomyces sp. M10(2022)]
MRSASLWVRSDGAQLAELVAKVDAGKLRVHVAAHRPAAELAAVHEDAGAGRLAGKTVVLAPDRDRAGRPLFALPPVGGPEVRRRAAPATRQHRRDHAAGPALRPGAGAHPLPGTPKRPGRHRLHRAPARPGARSRAGSAVSYASVPAVASPAPVQWCIALADFARQVRQETEHELLRPQLRRVRWPERSGWAKPAAVSAAGSTLANASRAHTGKML